MRGHLHDFWKEKGGVRGQGAGFAEGNRTIKRREFQELIRGAAAREALEQERREKATLLEEKEQVQRSLEQERSEKEAALAEREQAQRRCSELQADNDRVYAGHRGLEEEINFLKYRIGTLDELHESVAFGYWPHDGSFQDYTCKYPFERIEILPRGEVYTCCSGYIKHNYYIGNIYEEHESFEEIWNSDKAKKLRYSVQEGNFEFCQKKCRFFHMPMGKDNPIVPKNADVNKNMGIETKQVGKDWENFTVNVTPKRIMLSCDESCNLHCPSCRSGVKALSKEDSNNLYGQLIKIVRPMLKNCELLSALGTGELFASSALSRFMKTLNIDEFPKLNLNLTTNLQLLDEKKWEEFSNLLEFPKTIRISVDGATRETYEKNRLGGNWDRLKKNLAYLCDLRNNPSAHIDLIHLNFVVQENNYQEMEEFVAMAEKMGADAVEFQRLGNWGTFSEQVYIEKDVFNPRNSHYMVAIHSLKGLLSKKDYRANIIQNII